MAEKAISFLLFYFIMSIIIVTGSSLIIMSEATFWGKVVNMFILLVIVWIATNLAGRAIYHLGGRMNQ